MSLSNKILSTVTTKSKAIDIPEWGGEFEIRELTASQRDQYGFDATKDPANFSRGFSVRIIIDTLYDKEGNQVFTPSQAEQLSEQSGTLLADIAAQSQKLSGLSEDAVEEAEKN